MHRLKVASRRLSVIKRYSSRFVRFVAIIRLHSLETASKLERRLPIRRSDHHGYAVRMINRHLRAGEGEGEKW